eukprot:NODE_188_length_13518_cov_0.721142.p5 type:complete len:443 gc:universal NODE_188_length_13518_cov_0.721142:8316-9644(+)
MFQKFGAKLLLALAIEIFELSDILRFWPIYSNKIFFRMKQLNFNAITANLKKRNCSHLYDISSLPTKIDQLNNLEKEKIHLRTLQNKLGKVFNQNGQSSVDEMKILKSKYKSAELQWRQLKLDVDCKLKQLPNEVSDHTESVNRTIFQQDLGKPSEKIMEHDLFGIKHDLVDFKNASNVSGNSFYILKNKAVWLELALIKYALSFYESKGYQVLMTPDVVYKKIKDSCGYMPRNEKGSEDYALEGTDKVLTATAEIPLAGMYSNQTISLAGGPLLYVALGKAYRPETGSLNSESRGLYRVHQFSKVELFSLCTEDQSMTIFERFVKLQREFFTSLDFKLKLVEMSASELGASAFRKIDIEAYFPGRCKYGEISSTSNCTDYQTSRLNIKTKQNSRIAPVHTVNGTGCAIQRTMACAFESWQSNDRLLIPKALQKFTGFESIP